MSNIFKNIFSEKEWVKYRENIYLILLFGYIGVRIYNISWLYFSSIIPGFDTFTINFEYFVFPVILVVFYIINLIIEKQYNYKTILMDVVIFAVFAIVALGTDYEYNIKCLSLAGFIICSDVTSFKKICKVFILSVVPVTLGVILLSLLGWTGELVIIEGRFGRVAYNFGFIHYAIWARQFLFVFASYLYVRGKKTSWAELGIIAALSYVVFYFSTQRLTFITCILLLVMFVIFVKCELIKVNSIFITLVSLIAAPVMMLIAIGTALFYSTDNIILAKINSMMLGRLQLGKRAFEVMPMSLFGQDNVISITFNKCTDVLGANEYFFLDSGYLYMLFLSGILMSVITIVMYIYTHWKSCKVNDAALFVFVNTVLIYIFVDNPVHDISCCAIVLLAFKIMMNGKLDKIYSGINKKLNN